MKEYPAYGFLMILAYLLDYLNLRFLGYVWYDKVLHFTIGLFFAVQFFKVHPQEQRYKIATIFVFLYEIFVYIIYSLPFALFYEGFEYNGAGELFGVFFLKYQYFDEWLDIVSTWLGVILGYYLIDPIPERREKLP